MKHLKTFEQHSQFDGQELNEEILGGVKKFFTGHADKDEYADAKNSFMDALDAAEADVKKDPSKYVFNRESLEKKAKDNNYLGGLRIQRGGRDKSRFYVVYDRAATGWENITSAAGGYRKEILGN